MSHFQCPRCATVVAALPGQPLVCPSCGYGSVAGPAGPSAALTVWAGPGGPPAPLPPGMGPPPLPRYKDKTTAALLALFLGSLGIHKFYLGRVWLGLLYLAFFWTYVPLIAGIVEAIVAFGKAQAAWDAKWNAAHVALGLTGGALHPRALAAQAGYPVAKAGTAKVVGVTVLAVVLVVAGIGIVGFLLADGGSDPEVVQELDFRAGESFSAIDAATTYISDGDWTGARAELATADSQLRSLNGYLLRHQDQLDPDDQDAYATVVFLLQRMVRAEQLMTLWAEETSANFEAYAAEPVGSAAEAAALRSLEGSRRGADRASGAFEDLAGDIDLLRVADPALAAKLALDADTADGFREAADAIDEAADDMDALVQDARDAGLYIPPSPLAPDEDAFDASSSGLVSSELQDFFNTWDLDASGQIDAGEGEAFYYWVEDNVAYRYDDETEENPAAGSDVGDGRPGPDYTQTPTETFEEGKGDCEDMNALEVAFYNHWGIEAYQAYVNAETATGIDHAIAIVKVGDTVEEAESVMGRLDYYEFWDDDGWGIGAGVYAIVDNAYSDDYGFISSGIEPGQFTILEIHDLAGDFDRTVY